ncbi:hypothetical protein KDA_60690 [Dictyobacter alpinus]|uniref:Uncharacterized protein n=1 Tax=Dictyobacter alpinus TaxID=2014873 RepID=A0A402BGS9_9CHLR|nr:hypothetical protein KDA_60690 [Dictyobacter alpinus]
MYAIGLSVALVVACWIAFRQRPKDGPWHTNTWLLLPLAILFISPVALFHIPIVLLIPLYLVLLVGLYFQSKRASQLWYRNPLLLILIALVIVVLFKGTLLTVFILGAVVLGSLNFIVRKLFPK